MVRDARVTTIAISGGPCGGKTSLLARAVSDFAYYKNIKLFLVEEAATLLYRGNINYPVMTKRFQHAVLETQIALEQNATNAATEYLNTHPSDKVVILCDRGIMDGRGYYNSDEEFEKVLAEHGLTRSQIYDRYDGVVFLDSPAKDSPQFYTTANNGARTETASEAAVLNERTKLGWLSHPKFYSFSNQEHFIHKMDHALSAIFSLAGINPQETKPYRYLINGTISLSKILNSNPFFATRKTFFLESDFDQEVEYVTMQIAGNTTYYQTHLTFHNCSPLTTQQTAEERIRPISNTEFLDCLQRVDSAIDILKCKTYTFYIGGQIKVQIEEYIFGNQSFFVLCVPVQYCNLTCKDEVSKLLHQDAKLTSEATISALIKDWERVTSYFAGLTFTDVSSTGNYSQYEIAKNGPRFFKKILKNSR